MGILPHRLGNVSISLDKQWGHDAMPNLPKEYTGRTPVLPLDVRNGVSTEKPKVKAESVALPLAMNWKATPPGLLRKGIMRTKLLS